MLKIYSEINFFTNSYPMYAAHDTCYCSNSIFFNMKYVYLEVVVQRNQTNWYDLMLVMILAYSNRQTENVNLLNFPPVLQFCVYVNAHMYKCLFTVDVRLKILCSAAIFCFWLAFHMCICVWIANGLLVSYASLWHCTTVCKLFSEID